MRKTIARGQMSFFSEYPRKADTTSTFTSNLSIPIHRWFRYSAGFSASWVGEVLRQEKVGGRRRVLDPFAGSGTVLLEAERWGYESIGVEAHPFVARVALAKLAWRQEPSVFLDRALEILHRATHEEPAEVDYPDLIARCYPPEVLGKLDRLRKAWESTNDGTPQSELSWLALTTILRDCSPAGTAQWQYILPNKTKARPGEPFEAYEATAYRFAGDMKARRSQDIGPAAELFREDARHCPSVPDGWADLVVTSPPYANNYDYADATRLEMSFFGDVRGWGDLQDAVRRHLIRSCTQHVAGPGSDPGLDDDRLGPIRDELAQIYSRLETERESHGGKKAYHRMIVAYFQDMALFWKALRRVTHDGSLVCLVIGDSAPYGVHVPVDRWLGTLAVASGFHRFRFEKTRDRNVKWKNRKHRVPLHEGRLWVEG